MAFDIINESDSGKKFCRKFILWPKYWENYSPPTELNWNSIHYNKNNIKKLPEEYGVYAFVVKPNIAGMIHCNYLMYIGKAEKQYLSVRCKQYLQELRKPKPRILISQMLRCWKNHLYLYYATVDDEVVDISDIEAKLLSAYIPPINTVLPGKLNVIAKDIYRS